MEFFILKLLLIYLFSYKYVSFETMREIYTYCLGIALDNVFDYVVSCYYEFVDYLNYLDDDENPDNKKKKIGKKK